MKYNPLYNLPNVTTETFPDWLKENPDASEWILKNCARRNMVRHEDGHYVGNHDSQRSIRLGGRPAKYTVESVTKCLPVKCSPLVWYLAVIASGQEMSFSTFKRLKDKAFESGTVIKSDGQFTKPVAL